jgi:hypothetical protein
MDRSELLLLADRFGIVRPPSTLYADDPRALRLAMDAGEQPQLSATTANAGIPWAVTNILDPRAVVALTTPMTSEEIWGPATKKGDWTTLTAQFPFLEATGQTTSYGDYNDEGSTRANVSWMPQQSYFWQNIKRWGERELALYGAARIDYAAKLDYASALVMAKMMNAVNHYGVAGLQLYGGLTNPNLTAALTPSTKAAGGTQWIINGVPNATANEVVNDIQTIIYDLQAQLGGNLNIKGPMKLVTSPKTQLADTITNSYNVNVSDILKKNFPGLVWKTAVEYSTAGGELVQIIVDEIDGQRTAEPCFTEKMRSHPVIPGLSSFRQKMSAGSWGLIMFRPLAVKQMLGV